MKTFACFLLIGLAGGTGAQRLRTAGTRDLQTTASAAGVPISDDCTTKRKQDGFDVVLLMGQSNMVGLGFAYDPAIDGVQTARIQQWSRDNRIIDASDRLQHAEWKASDRFTGMGLSFARSYLSTLPRNRRVLLVPTAYGGTGLVNGPWSPGGNLFEDAMVRVKRALDSNPGNCMAAALWHQGENDEFTGISTDVYSRTFDNMIATMRSLDPRMAKTPVVVGEFTPTWSATVGGNILRSLREVPNRVSRTALAPSTGLGSNPGDAIHFSSAAMRTYGTRYFDALSSAINNINVQPSSCRSLLMNGDFEFGLGDWYGQATMVLSSDRYAGSSSMSVANGWVGQNVGNIVAGTSYKFAGQYKMVGNSGLTTAGINFIDQNGQRISAPTVELSVSGSFTSFVLEAVAPGGTVRAFPYVYQASATTPLLVDGLSFSRSNCCKFLFKEGFEAGLGDWYGQATVMALSSDRSAGSSSMSIAGGWVGQSVADVIVGNSYTFAGKYKTVGAASLTTVGINFIGQNGQTIFAPKADLSESGSFTTFSVEGVAPMGTVRAFAWAYRYDSTSPMLVDELSLAPSDCGQ